MKTLYHSYLRKVFLFPATHSIRAVGFISIALVLILSAGRARAQGTLTNGWTHTGTISPVGDSDSWTFSANAGDTIVIRVGEITSSAFTPRIRLLTPTAVLQASTFGTTAAEIAVTATNSGTFSVIVDDANGTQTGDYRLTLAQSPGVAVFVAPGDEGGPMTNDVMHTGTILPGDLDVWTFTGTSNDSIIVRVGNISGGTNSFTPWVRLYGPNGKLLDSGFGSTAGEVTATATNTGTFLVVVGDGNGALSGSGTYRLTLAKTGDAVVVSDGDEGGPMTNDVMHTGTILPGDLDAWTFTGTSNDSIIVRVGNISGGTNSFTPWVRLYGPNGKLLDSGFGSTAGEVTATATNTGTFLVVVGDGNGALSGSGAYRLTLAKTGDPVVVSAGDEGGPMTNGVLHLGTILPGDLDAWTFSANIGDAIIVRVGESSNTNSFTPWVRLYGPNGKLLSSGFGSIAGEASTTATNAGTFLVVIGDGNGALSGSGNYQLTLAKTGDPVVISPGDDGGPMTNDVMHLGTIIPGDLDVWTFSANTGDAIIVRVGEITTTNSFTPWVRLYGPNGKLLDSGFGSIAGEVTATATNSGTFLVVVGDGNGTISGSGNYRLTLVKTGDAIVVSTGDDGGPMTNGVMHLGTVLPGDLDAWTFSATSGDSILVRAGNITGGTNSFTPWVRLYGPDGKLLSTVSGSVTAEVSASATNSGTFLVVIGDGNGTISGSGTYRLTLAKTGDAVVVSAGDDGGPMTNDVMHTGTVLPGDLDLWTFNATIGDSIVVRVGNITGGTNSFTPWLRLYGPNGKFLDEGFGSVAGEAAVTATNSGTFLVVVGDGNGIRSGSGTYRLTLGKTGDAVVVSPGDEGGPMTNGIMNVGTALPGDLDLWTFNAIAGQAVIVRVGEISTTNSFTPWVRLYGPNGKLLGQGFGAVSGEVAVTATNTGVFIALISDGNGSISGSGQYRLTLAKTGDAAFVSAGDEGGPLEGSNIYPGTISPGDLDVFTFTACRGDFLSMQMDESISGSTLTPWLRLFGRDGVLIKSSFGAATALIDVVATNTGVFTLVAADGSGNFVGSGGYQLTVNGLTSDLKLCIPVISGTNANVSGVGGTPGVTFILFTHTNVAAPFVQWTPILTNQFDTYGVFGSSNFFSKAQSPQFFRLQVP